MSRYSYAGKFVNPTEDWYVKAVGDDKYEVWIREDRAPDGSAPPDYKHRKSPTFEEAGDAEEWIASVHEFFEQNYEDYLEENHHEIVQMERWEDFKNEY